MGGVLPSGHVIPALSRSAGNALPADRGAWFGAADVRIVVDQVLADGVVPAAGYDFTH